ncbi:MAG: hypothetical protein Q4B28_05750 [bacterium]|nr:hypothetical protein [bacterium]
MSTNELNIRVEASEGTIPAIDNQLESTKQLTKNFQSEAAIFESEVKLSQLDSEAKKQQIDVLRNLDLSKEKNLMLAIDQLMIIYKDFKKSSGLRARINFLDKINYTPDSKPALKRIHQQSKVRLSQLKSMKAGLKTQTSIPRSYMAEVMKMVKDIDAFNETLARARMGENAPANIRNADHSIRGIKKNIRYEKEQQNYFKKQLPLQIESAIRQLDIQDKEGVRDYLIAVEEGRITHPSQDPYFFKHKADILYLCCLNAQLGQKVLQLHKLVGISRKDLGKYRSQLNPAVQNAFVGPNQVYMPAVNSSFDLQSVPPQQLGGLRGLLRTGIDKITPKMTPHQKEMWAQGAELAILGVGIFQLGKWFFGKDKDGNKNFWSKLGTAGAVLLGGQFASQAFLGKDLGSVFKAAVNGGQEWNSMTKNFKLSSNPQKIDQMVVQPQHAMYLYAGMTPREVYDLLKMDPQSQIYETLEARYKADTSPNGKTAYEILKKIDKHQPKAQLEASLNALLPAGKIPESQMDTQIDVLTTVYANNMAAVNAYLDQHPHLEYNKEKEEEILNTLKANTELKGKDMDALVQAGFFKVQEKYDTKF